MSSYSSAHNSFPNTPSSNTGSNNQSRLQHQSTSSLSEHASSSTTVPPHSLPLYRNPNQPNHRQPSLSDLQQSSVPSAAPSLSSAAALPQGHPQSISISAEPSSSRHHLLSSTVRGAHIQPQQPQQQQQQLSSQLLSSPYSTTPSSNPFSGSAAKPAGGGGSSSSGSAGSSGLNSLAIAQLHLLITTLTDRNYEARRKEIRKLAGESMEINNNLVRKLIAANHTHIMSSSNSRSFENSPNTSHRFLSEQIKEIASSPQDVKERFSDAITPTQSDPDIFRDFDVAAFMAHFGLDALQRSILAVGLKHNARPDLRSKGYDILSKSFPAMIDILANSSKHPELTPEGIAFFLQQLLSDPVPAFLTDYEKLNVSYAARSRYKNTLLPQEIYNITEPIEKLRRQESLVQIFQQIGTESTSSLEACRGVLKRKWGVQLSEDEVADVLALMATSRNPMAWNADIFIRALQQGNLAPSFDWEQVIKSFDREDFMLESTDGLHIILSAIQQGANNPDFPIYKLWGGRWSHPRTQWSILKAYIKADDLDVTRMPGIRKVFSSADFMTASSALKLMVATFETHKFISYDAVDVLLYMVVSEHISGDVRMAAQAELDKAAKFAPELLLCGALMVPKPWTANLEGIISTLLNIFFEGHTSHQLVFWRLWQVDKALVVNRFVEYHSRNPLNITRILDISQELRCLSDLLEVQNAAFVLDVASLASRREYLNLEKWLQEMINKYGGEFVMECYGFLKLKADAEYLQAREGTKQQMVSLRVGPVHTFLTLLDKNNPPMTPELQEQVTVCQRLCIQAYPRLINLGSGLDPVILANNHESNTFPPHIDKDMQQNYKRLYSQETEIREMVNYLQRLKSSTSPRDQDLFACMIHGLFDEYHCYPAYPLQALATTSVLFGSIILFKLIDGIPLRVALAMVWHAVRDYEPNTSMYKFGLQALVQFKDRLKEWKAYCALLVQVSGLRGTEIWNIAQEVISGVADKLIEGQSVNGTIEHVEESAILTNGNSIPQMVSPPPSTPPFHSLYADPPLRDLSYEDPSEEVQDKVLFIVNNVSQSNLETKLKDLREYLQEEHHQWFADYLVVQRAKMEPNYHKLYLELLDQFGHKGLTAEVLRETYINVIKLLNAEATLSSSSERQHLKNLACWLGGLTIARDKPIKFKNISFKDLLIEGYETDRLIVVLPFTCKVLEQANNSTIFKPPNPWLMAIIRLLAELYQHVELKLNLKFEIEVLCNNLDLDIKTIEPASDIREIRDRPAVKEEEILPSIENMSLQESQDFSPISDPVQSVFSDHIVINSMVQTPALKRILQVAIERAIREIIGPVVERSVTIASISAAQLVQKDFATEGDENNMRSAAHKLVSLLAGSLAQVTCKDPLRMSMSNNIRNLLLQGGFTEQSVSDQTITLCVNDNIEAACRFIEKAAQERALPEIDDSLGPAYQARKRHRDQRINQPFISHDISRIVFQLPEAFRLKPGGLTPQQLSIYEDFGRFNRINGVEAGRTSVVDGMASDYIGAHLQSGATTVDSSHLQPRILEHPPGASQQQFDQKDIQNKISSLLNELRKVAKDSVEQRIEEIRGDHAIFHYMEAILSSVSAASPTLARIRDPLCTAVANQICQVLYTEAQKQLEVEALVCLLQKVCDISASTAKDVVMWLTREQEDERIFNVPVTVTLLKAQLLDIAHLDISLSRYINARKPLALEFFAQLMREIVFGDNPFAFRTNFAKSLDAVGNWLKQDSNNKVALDLLRDLHSSEDEKADVYTEEHEKRDQNEYIFTEWMLLCQHVSTNEKNHSAFIMQLYSAKVLVDMPASCEFFRTCIEFCIAEYERENALVSGSVIDSYVPIDALAKLVILLVKYQSEDGQNDGILDKAEYLNSILALFVFIFNHHYEQDGENFAQKVFFRLFSSMLYEYHLVENNLRDYHEQILETFAKCFLTIQPVFFPMFTFDWMALISHRYFMPKLLNLDGEKGWATFANLLETLLAYVGASLKDQSLAPIIKVLYRGVLRILLVLHHDFPEFLAEYHFSICEVIPVHCTQLRNLILSAFPATLSDLPDPFTAGLKVDRLPEVKIAPKISGDVLGPLTRSGVKDLVDSFLSSSEGSNHQVLNMLLDKLEGLPKKDYEGSMFASRSVSTGVINSLVLYVAMEAIEAAQTKSAPSFQQQSAHTALFVKLAKDLGPQGRYFFFSAIANHLRYPNSHTHYFSCTFLYLFGHVQEQQTSESDVREQITRVLLERLIVHRPHPWGLIITLLELLKNPIYDFWNLPFIKSAPEVCLINAQFSSLEPFI
ncbi:CCR4-NOT core subunit cdc39 [Rhizina undulata]